jgi:hypothetical protein
MSASDLYQARRARYAAEVQAQRRRSLIFSWARGIAFAAFAAVAFLMLLRSGQSWGMLPPVLAATLAIFVILAVLHSRVLAREKSAAELIAINEEALARLERDWQRLPLPAPALNDGAAPPVARDLGLLGRASVYHLLSTAHSPSGKQALATALLAPATNHRERQAAVAELAGRLDLRQHLELATRRFERAPSDCAGFLDWAEGEPWYDRHRLIEWLARGLTLTTVLAFVATIVTPLPGWVLLLAAAINLSFGYGHAKEMAGIFDRIGGREGEFQDYAAAFAALTGEGPPWRSELLVALDRQLRPANLSVPQWMRRLHSGVEWADARHSALLHAPLTAFLLWDFHALARLERWQRGVGREVRGWLAALGEFELLAAFSTLLDEEAGWCQPTVAPEEELLAAERLGHPLLPAPVRVANDVTVGPAGTFLLVTGSNMSGKSTLLRALGVNIVLAQAGAPVCASALRLPPVRLGTSILVEDSLADGVSFFMAELLRIRTIVRDAEGGRGGPRTFYLLDEILRGTNSRERRIAVQRVLAHLLEAGALGAVSTHDLELVEVPELARACQAVHFRETLHSDDEGPKMTFDYQLRPGPATTANALVLLDLVGIDERAAR